MGPVPALIVREMEDHFFSWSLDGALAVVKKACDAASFDPFGKF